jgi:hypothetical protein
MSWHGLGFLDSGFRPPHGGANGALRGLILSPSDDWNGIAGSGFANLPVNPLRTTAKPACRLLVPDFQSFTSTLDVGVQAWALDGNTLIGGVDRVRFHYEGRSVDVVQPRWHSLETAVGSRRYFGYWVRLRAPRVTRGQAHLYIEVIPADATMQSRVCGPFVFNPVSQRYLHAIEVAASPPELPGKRYRTLQAAFQFLTNLGTATTRPANSIITITEPGFYEAVVATGLGFTQNPRGRIYVEATEPVMIGFSSFTSDDANRVQPRHPCWFRGQNITIDMKNISHFIHDNQGGSGGSGHVFDGCNFIVSGAGRAELWRAGARPVPGITGNLMPAWFLECTVKDVTTPFINAQCVRGGSTTHGYGDVCTNSRCVVDHVTHDWDSFADFAVHVPALSITGPTGATFSISGGSDASSRTLTARVNGTLVGTFTVGRTQALFDLANSAAYNPIAAGQGYYIADVAAWLNSLPGWNASVIDNTRRAAALSRQGTKGQAFSNLAIGSGLTLTTFFDAHDDWYQINDAGPDNVILFGNRGTRLSTQNFMLNGVNGTRDFIAIGNAFMNLVDGETSIRLSQLSAAHSHVVIAHNSMPAQGMRLNSNLSFIADSYCLIANNAFRSLGWGGAPAVRPAFANNAIDAGAEAPGENTGTIIGGDYASKFVNAIIGDFSPAGVLLDNPRSPVAITELSELPREQHTAVGSNGFV